MSQMAPELWTLELTRRESSVARDEEINPDDPGYLSGLFSEVPAMGALVRLYLQEAIKTYDTGCYLASTVMLVVAAEAAFSELSMAFAKWLKGVPGSDLTKELNNPRNNYIRKFTEFRKRLESERANLSKDLAYSLDLDMNSVLERFCERLGTMQVIRRV